MNKKGFTLIELLVVVSIIGVLSTIVLGSLGTARTQSYDTIQVKKITELQKAIEIFEIDNGYYPGRTADGWVPFGGSYLFAINCPNGNYPSYMVDNWNRLISDLAEYLPENTYDFDSSECIWYEKGSYLFDNNNCDHLEYDPEYTMIFDTREKNFYSRYPELNNGVVVDGFQFVHCVYPI